MSFAMGACSSGGLIEGRGLNRGFSVLAFKELENTIQIGKISIILVQSMDLLYVTM